MDHCIERELRSTTLTIAILIVVFFLVFRLALAWLFRLVLIGLVAVLTLSMLTGLTTLLALSILAALLTLLLHIVCHKTFLLRKARETCRAFGFVAN